MDLELRHFKSFTLKFESWISWKDKEVPTKWQIILSTTMTNKHNEKKLDRFEGKEKKKKGIQKRKNAVTYLQLKHS